jgi:CheY-like chemotaxis protein
VKTVRLIHWNEDEGLERQRQLEALGFDTQFDFGDGLTLVRLMQAGMPDAVVIDLSRMPSHGREVAHGLRTRKTTRQLPIVFVGGEPEKVQRTRQLLPDATYTTWGRIKTALPKAIAKPPTNPVVPDHNTAWGRSTVDKLGAKPGFKVALLALKIADRQTAWLIWPKKASGVESDLDGNVVRSTGLAAGWVDFKVCSVDATWSGLAFKRRK